MLQNIPSQTDEKPCTTKSLLLDNFYLLKETIQSRVLKHTAHGKLAKWNTPISH